MENPLRCSRVEESSNAGNTKSEKEERKMD